MRTTMALFIGVLLPGLEPAGAEAVATKIVHTPPSHIVPAYRFHLTALIEDPAGIMEARCYFRAEHASDYVYIVLENDGQGLYHGVLPAPVKMTKNVQYLFQVLNGNNEVITTTPMRIPVHEDHPPPWQTDVGYDALHLLTELDGRGSRAPGFLEDHVLQSAKSSERYGAVSDIHPGADPGETTATHTGTIDVEPEPEVVPADSGSSVEPKAPRKPYVRNLVIGGIVVGGAAGAAIALSDSGGSSGDSTPPTPTPTPPPPGVNVTFRLSLDVSESESVANVNFARGTATGPSGSQFMLEAEGPWGVLSQAVTIGASESATIQIDIDEPIFSCTTVIVRGTVTAAGGGTLGSQQRTFNVKCD